MTQIVRSLGRRSIWPSDDARGKKIHHLLEEGGWFRIEHYMQEHSKKESQTLLLYFTKRSGQHIHAEKKRGGVFTADLSFTSGQRT